MHEDGPRNVTLTTEVDSSVLSEKNVNKIKKNQGEKDILPENSKEATLEKVLEEECEKDSEAKASSCNTLSTSSVSVASSLSHCSKKSGKKPGEYFQYFTIIPAFVFSCMCVNEIERERGKDKKLGTYVG